MTRRSVELPNYSTGEGACRCGCGLQMRDELVLALQSFVRVLERAWGAKVRHVITSGARCSAHNGTVPKSSPTSQHTTGNAADGHFEYCHNGGWHRIDSSDVAAAAVKSGLWGGVGHLQYAREGTYIVHLDLRAGPAVTW